MWVGRLGTRLPPCTYGKRLRGHSVARAFHVSTLTSFVVVTCQNVPAPPFCEVKGHTRIFCAREPGNEAKVLYRWNALRHARLHNRIAFRGVNCHYDRSVFSFPTQQLIEHNRQASETETFPLASRKHGKHIASLHKLSTTSSCSGLRS